MSVGDISKCRPSPSYYTPRDLERKQENKKRKYLFGEGAEHKEREREEVNKQSLLLPKGRKEGRSYICQESQDEHLLMLVLKDK